MQNNYYFLKNLSGELLSEIKGLKLATCFSQNKDELVFGFCSQHREFWIKSILNHDISCLTFPKEYARAKKNSVNLFQALVDLEVLQIKQYKNERSFSVKFEKNYELLFKMYGKSANIILFENEKYLTSFNNRYEQDKKIDISQLDRPILQNQKEFEEKGIQKVFPTFGKAVVSHLELQNFAVSAQWDKIEKLLDKFNNATFYVLRVSNSIVFRLFEEGEVLFSSQNAIESITTNGKIVTSISITDGKANLSISDNGIGMPEKVFKNLGQKGNTFGKASGTGLGIYDAYEQLKRWNADIYYQTEKNLGTTANLVFEIVDENPLFPSEILIPEDSTVVILDDDPSVHESWRQRFKAFQDNNVSFKYFEQPNEATIVINELKSTGTDFLFLGDYDLRDRNINGLKFIEDNNIIDHSVLVTSSIKAVLNECRVKQIPVISKSIQSTISIHTVS